MSKRTRNLYVWKTHTEDGRKRQVQAQLFGTKWAFHSRVLKEEEDWTPHETPSLEDLESLEEVIFNKYQRKHVSWDQLENVRQLIAARRG